MKKLSVLLLAQATITSALAQTFEDNVNRYETPLGMSSVQDIDMPAQRVRDERFNRITVNNRMPGFALTTVGNLINVTNEGNNNTIHINATQTNSGDQTIQIEKPLSSFK
ncbi:MAG: hypothetical protein R3194_03365 [Limnobacter sp.]|nr:hypothetical protein [Limnobacter sp.]